MKKFRATSTQDAAICSYLHILCIHINKVRASFSQMKKKTEIIKSSNTIMSFSQDDVSETRGLFQKSSRELL